MCGICGILDPDATIHGRNRMVARMNDGMTHRGPDGDGVYGDETVSLGHRRLAIIDLDTGNQPMSYRHWHVVFNGEIYNFIALREQLSALGHQFISRSDTEVILHAFEEWGPDCVHRLTGMFAIALWDSKKKRLYLFRDRVGIKPLYYGRLARGIVFCSEIDPLLRATEISRRLNKRALLNFLGYGFSEGPETMFADIFEISPGHMAVVDLDGQVHCRRYWHMNNRQLFTGSIQNAVEELENMLTVVVRDHLVSDVPVCTFLSGGIDSSGVSAIAAECAETQMTAYTVSFPDNQYDETRWAMLVAEKYGLDHRIIRAEDHELTLADVEVIIRHVGQPFADSSCIPTYMVCHEAAKNFKVVLSGDGGDEAFYGYETFAWLAKIGFCKQFPEKIRRSALRVIGRLPRLGRFDEKTRQIEKALRYSLLPLDRGIEYLNAILDPAQLRRMLTDTFRKVDQQTADLVKKNSENSYRIMSEYLFNSSLPQDMLSKVDRMSMRASLEVRVPLLDHRIVEFAASLPEDFHFREGQKKYLLKRVLSDRLPRTVLEHKKQGFSIPLHRFYSQSFIDACEERLTATGAFNRSIFRQEIIKKTLAANRNINRTSKRVFSIYTWTHLLWMMMQLEIWADSYNVTFN